MVAVVWVKYAKKLDEDMCLHLELQNLLVLPA